MSFFQNLFDQEFRGSWVLTDRQYVINFTLPANKNKQDIMISWNTEPYNLAAPNNILTLNYAWDVDFKNYSALAVDVSGATPASTTALEVVNKLNANAIFAEMYVAALAGSGAPFPYAVRITKKPSRPRQQIRTYISNGSAESILRFNKMAGVGELPSYFERHTIANRFNFPDSQAMLVLLDTADPTDQQIITEAGFDFSSPLADWELLKGRASGLFMFRKITLDAQNRITQIIEYGAGSQVGDFGRKIKYNYPNLTTTNPDQITEEPHVIESADLVTP